MALVGKILVWGVAAVLLLFVAWHIFIALRIGALEQANAQRVDFGTLALTSKPNQYLLAPTGTTTAQPHGQAPVFAAPPEQLRDALLAVIEGAPRTRVLEKSADGMAFTAVQQTALMRYPDIISVEVRPADGGSTLLVYSRSLFGHSDLGANKARVDGWLEQVRARLS